MKKLVFLGACLMALASSPVKAQTGRAEVVTVRIIDGNPRDLRIIVSYGEEKSEVFVVESKANREGQIALNEAYQKVFQKLYRDGYTLKSAYSIGPFLPGFIFVKGL